MISELVKLRWNGAMVVLYDPAKEKEITSNSISYAPEKGHFQIQLFAGKKPIDIKNEFSSLQKEFKELSISEHRGADGLYRYSVKPFSNRAEAINVVRKIRALGWEDAFIKFVIPAKE